MTRRDGMYRPRARDKGLESIRSGAEMVVYDTERQQVHQLNTFSADVWSLCDGRRTVRQIADALKLDDSSGRSLELVWIAVMKLSDAHLLIEPAPGADDLRSRRLFLKSVAKTGAAAVPAVVSITAPLASASASTGTASCRQPTIDQSLCIPAREGLCCTKLGSTTIYTCKRVGNQVTCA